MSNGGRGNKRTADVGAGGQRRMKVRVKKAKGLKLSSKLWLERQLNDPYVDAAKTQGLRSRAAFKLMQIDDKHGFLTSGKRVFSLRSRMAG
jgi:23S rRNA (uridine2552-2'-O)-methyltransferase